MKAQRGHSRRENTDEGEQKTNEKHCNGHLS